MVIRVDKKEAIDIHRRFDVPLLNAILLLVNENYSSIIQRLGNDSRSEQKQTPSEECS